MILFSKRWLGIFQALLFLFTFSCWANLATETIYLTWQRNPSTTMTIQWISLTNQQQTIVSYRLKKDPASWKESKGSCCKFPHSSQYLIHQVELTNLLPNTDYLFRINQYEREYLFRTVPQQLDTELRFVVGGDMYHDGLPLMIKTCQQAAQTNPHFALVGGDIAYAVGSIHLPFQKIDRWIEWIKAWHATMITPQGHLIPIVAALGNHDLIGHFDQEPSQAAIFSTLFPMPGKRIYNVLDFNSYLSIFILDSGHANPISGQQTNWLRSTLQARQHITHRLAIYHVPAYPSIRAYHNPHSAAIRRSWVPLFESGGIQTAFEHHDHAYKRSYPLLKNRIHPNGVIYLGDGAWGVEKPRTPRTTQRRAYLAKFLPMRHFIAVTLTPTQQIFKSINEQGYIIDEYSKNLSLSEEQKTPVRSVK